MEQERKVGQQGVKVENWGLLMGKKDLMLSCYNLAYKQSHVVRPFFSQVVSPFRFLFFSQYFSQGSVIELFMLSKSERLSYKKKIKYTYSNNS